ncbi:MAG: histidine--tRNA ligase [Planctomycetota bacterium]
MPKIQSPKGTRDFYPAEMAWQQHLLDTWRAVSVRNGFEQVDGPIFEKLDLYKVKSGEGIVSELFSFRRDNGKTDFAIRPEFTPTLARMVAQQANSLPKPIKWFCTPNFCRAERPQRGRLREFWQWNVDLLGMDSPAADAEVIFTLVDFLAECGLTKDQVKVKISHRDVVSEILGKLGVPEDKRVDAFNLLDARDKMSPEDFTKAAGNLGMDPSKVQRFEEVCRRKYPAGDLDHLARSLAMDEAPADLAALDEQLAAFGIAEWCEYDLGIVRGLAYYTGTVFEVHETTGVERAIAGGGRYDKLIELFDGPPTPAIGFGMGDVVLTNLLHDKGLIPENVMPQPDAFVFAASDDAAAKVSGITAQLRRAGLHTRMSYKTTRNVGKLLKDAQKARARFAVIVGEGLELKDLESGEQASVELGELAQRIGG